MKSPMLWFDPEYRRRPPSLWNLLALLLPGLIVFWLFYESKVDSAIALRQRTTEAVINVHDPPNHDRYGYQFTVNKHNYFGWVIPGRISYRIGESVLVYYDPNDPQTNNADNFAEVAARSAALTEGPILMMVGMAAYILVLRRKRLKLRLKADSRS
jgi:hypothetical protein